MVGILRFGPIWNSDEVNHGRESMLTPSRWITELRISQRSGTRFESTELWDDGGNWVKIEAQVVVLAPLSICWSWMLQNCHPQW